MELIKRKFLFRPVALFDELSRKQSAFLKEHSQSMFAKPHKVLFREGYNSRGLYLLEKGKVKIYQINNDGEEQIVYIYTPGEIMGYRSILSEEPHPVTASAIEESSITFIPKTPFLEVLNKSLPLTRRLLENLAQEFNVWINTFSILSQRPVRERIALILLILNEKYKLGSETRPVVINLSRLNFANYARTTIESLSRVLASFRSEGLILIDGRKLLVLEPQALESIVFTA